MIAINCNSWVNYVISNVDTHETMLLTFYFGGHFIFFFIEGHIRIDIFLDLTLLARISHDSQNLFNHINLLFHSI